MKEKVAFRQGVMSSNQNQDTEVKDLGETISNELLPKFDFLDKQNNRQLISFLLSLKSRPTDDQIKVLNALAFQGCPYVNPLRPDIDNTIELIEFDDSKSRMIGDSVLEIKSIDTKDVTPDSTEEVDEDGGV